LRLEDDARWQKFLNRWSEWNVMLGYNEARMKASLKTLGIDEIPSTVSFSP
jgi:polar amino acid transport system substrate-binding protein